MCRHITEALTVQWAALCALGFRASFMLSLSQQHRQTTDSQRPAAGWSGTWETRIRELALWESQHEVRTDELNERLLSGFISSFRATEGSQLLSYEADEMLDTRTIWNKGFCTIKAEIKWNVADEIQFNSSRSKLPKSLANKPLTLFTWVDCGILCVYLNYFTSLTFICHKQPEYMTVH